MPVKCCSVERKMLHFVLPGTVMLLKNTQHVMLSYINVQECISTKLYLIKAMLLFTFLHPLSWNNLILLICVYSNKKVFVFFFEITFSFKTSFEI